MEQLMTQGKNNRTDSQIAGNWGSLTGGYDQGKDSQREPPLKPLVSQGNCAQAPGWAL